MIIPAQTSGYQLLTMFKDGDATAAPVVAFSIGDDGTVDAIAVNGDTLMGVSESGEEQRALQDPEGYVFDVSGHRYIDAEHWIGSVLDWWEKRDAANEDGVT